MPSASNQRRFLRPALTCETTSDPRVPSSNTGNNPFNLNWVEFVGPGIGT